MKQHVYGQMISGELCSEQNEFTVTGIKNIPTQSVWNERQVREMYELLTKVKNSSEDSLILSTGMLPILMNRREIEDLLQELQTILASMR
jgi:hypothetical protein